MEYNRVCNRIKIGIAFKKIPTLLLFICLLDISECGYTQNANANDSNQNLTLGQCIDYALKHQPALNQSYINQAIVKTTNSISLSGWLPQVNLNGDLTHYFQLPSSSIPNSTPGSPPTIQKTGVINSFYPTVTASQAIFSPQLLYAAKSAHLYTKQAEQVTDSTKIDLVVTVSKSFYNLLLTLKQIDVLKEDTARLDKNLSDTYHQYIGGIVDETDYDEAAITLNNSKAQLKQATENVIPQYASLKQVMGYPPTNQFNVSFDTTQMKTDILYDTTLELQYEKRIEYQELQTAKSLQHQLTSYYQNAFLPTLSGVFYYNYAFQNNSAASLFSTAYPYSYIGLSLSFPIFTGFARLENIHKSKLQEQLLDWAQVGLKSQIYSDYTSALANYKSNLFNLNALDENVVLAKRTYSIVSLQYVQGVVAYLNVITAESNLITSEIGYLNALFQLLSSKIDLERAMGVISY
jgi:outer membrane protein TolC